MIGLPGAGKSAVAPLLARALGYPSVDLDTEIERSLGRTVAAILDESGENAFRDAEERALEAALRAPSTVIACGGGVLIRPVNRERLRRHTWVVWLRVDPERAAERLRAHGTPERPLLRGGALAERLRALLDERGAAYADAADASVDASAASPEEVVEAIRRLWDRARTRWERSES